MPTNLNKVTTGSVISASEFKSNDAEVEKFLNGGMIATDLDGSQWVKTNHIRPPNFFGSPAPRTELVSSDVHYRHRHSSLEQEFSGWKDVSLENMIPVEGMSATMHVTPKEPGANPVAHIMANCYARELSFGQGSDWGRSTSSQDTQVAYNKYNFATFYMFVQAEDEEPWLVPHTGRRIYAGSSESERSRPTSPQNLCWQAKVKLQHGINHVWIGVMIQHESVSTIGKRLLISNRNLIADVHYL